MGRFSRRQIDDIFLLFFPENRILHFMPMSPVETICMKRQIFFGEKLGKYLKMSSAAIFTQHAKRDI